MLDLVFLGFLVALGLAEGDSRGVEWVGDTGDFGEDIDVDAGDGLGAEGDLAVGPNGVRVGVAA